MGHFNLLDEQWLLVMSDDKGTVNEVSIKELFKNAHQYKRLAGETQTQDFAILRLLLAILHTVFSRFDAEGKPYQYIELDNLYREIHDAIDEDDADQYSVDLMNTWENLWTKKEFPKVIIDYLDKWQDRFNLFDQDYPFYQVSKKDLDKRTLSKLQLSEISAKTFNRTISESGNKIALFSPRYDSNENKELITQPELARWLFTYQGYSGLSDKVIFGQGGKESKDKYKASKGWLFDLGGITLVGSNLFETLMLNLALNHPEPSFEHFPQNPCWENSGDRLLSNYLASKPINTINNLSELYTNWSRAIYIDPDTDMTKPFSFGVVKLPEIDHQNQFLETMTLWRFNSSGEAKGTFTPRKHNINEAVWRSFGLFSLPNYENHRRPGIIDWLSKVHEFDSNIKVAIQSVSMKDDGNATSWVPTDEICDYLNINEHVLEDILENGWIPRINEEVELIKTVIGETLKMFASEIKIIRNLSNTGFIDTILQDAYFTIDHPFREWLVNLQPDDSKDQKIMDWRTIMRKIILEKAQQMINSAGKRDYLGTVEDNKLINIATAYNKFIYQLHKRLPERSNL